MRDYDDSTFPKWFGAVLIVLLCSIIGIYGFCKMLHCNDIDKIQIIQNIDGKTEVRRDGGWYARFFPRIWDYPKASVEICSESDKDAVQLLFSNKTTASLNCQIGYRIDSTNDEQVIRLHQLVEGKDDKIWRIVQTSLQTAAQRVASQYTPSESVEKFDEFQQKIAKAILHDSDLLEKGIDVVSFTCAGLPKYDKQTLEQFDRQKAADLAKRLAEAEKMKYEAEVLKTEANYKQQIAEMKGKAEAEQAAAVQAAEKEKKLAEIEAQKKVAVQELEKQEAMIKAGKEKEVAEIEVQKQKEVAKIEAEKLLEVAEIQKKTEAANLESIKLKADQKIAEAEAKKIAIEKSGAITELQQAELDLQKQIAQYKWDAIGKAVAGIKLPTMMNIGSDSTKSGQSALDTLIQTMTVEKLNAVTPAIPAKK